MSGNEGGLDDTLSRTRILQERSIEVLGADLMKFGLVPRMGNPCGLCFHCGRCRIEFVGDRRFWRSGDRIGLSPRERIDGHELDGAESSWLKVRLDLILVGGSSRPLGAWHIVACKRAFFLGDRCGKGVGAGRFAEDVRIRLESGLRTLGRLIRRVEARASRRDACCRPRRIKICREDESYRFVLRTVFGMR